MRNSLLSNLSLINASGMIIIAAIVVLLLMGVSLTLYIRARYAGIARDLKRGRDDAHFDSRVLLRIVQSTRDALRTGSAEVNTQAIVEQSFQTELGGLLVGERFVKAMTGLVIIMGLVGTFYGLSASIGRLTALLSGQAPSASDVAASLTEGLTETLSGMSVAFTSSLFGIVSAVLLTLLGVFLNIADRRLSVMVQIESYLDNAFLAGARGSLQARGGGGPAPSQANSLHADARVEQMVHGFGESVTRLSGAVSSFENALANFASTTRDFKEFNHHLKDNIQRMSLSFGDLSDTLKQEVSTLRGRERG